MSKNLYLDATTKDLVLTAEKNLKLTNTLTEFVSQKIENLLTYFYGEWFLNYEGGIPYFEKIFTKNPDINLVNTILLRQIKLIDEIIEIIRFDTSFDAALRTFSVDFEVKASDGETVEGTFAI